MSFLARTLEREKFIDFIGISQYEQMDLILKQDNINKLDDLTTYSKKFGVQNRVFYPLLSRRLDKDKEFKKHFCFVSDEIQNAKITLEDRLIEFFEDRMFAIYTIKNNPQD